MCTRVFTFPHSWDFTIVCKTKSWAWVWHEHISGLLDKGTTFLALHVVHTVKKKEHGTQAYPVVKKNKNNKNFTMTCFQFNAVKCRFISPLYLHSNQVNTVTSKIDFKYLNKHPVTSLPSLRYCTYSHVNITVNPGESYTPSLWELFTLCVQPLNPKRGLGLGLVHLCVVKMEQEHVRVGR